MSGPGSWQAALQRIYGSLQGRKGSGLGWAIGELEKKARTAPAAKPLRQLYTAIATRGNMASLDAAGSAEAAVAAGCADFAELLRVANGAARAYARATAPGENAAVLADEFVGEWTATFVGQMVCACAATRAAAATVEPEAAERALAETPTALAALAAMEDLSAAGDTLWATIKQYCSADVQLQRLVLRFFVTQSLAGAPSSDCDVALLVSLSGSGVEGVVFQDKRTGNTALHMAVANKELVGWKKVVCTSGLLAVGADLNITNKNGQSALQMAMSSSPLLYAFFVRSIALSVIQTSGADSQRIAALERENAKLKTELGEVRQHMRGMQEQVSTILLSFGALLKCSPGTAFPAEAMAARPVQPPNETDGAAIRSDADGAGRKAGGGARQKGAMGGSDARHIRGLPVAADDAHGGAGGAASVAAATATPTAAQGAGARRTQLAPLGRPGMGPSGAAPVQKLAPLGGTTPGAAAGKAHRGSQRTTRTTLRTTGVESVGDTTVDSMVSLTDPFHRESAERAQEQAAADAGASAVSPGSESSPSRSGSRSLSRSPSSLSRSHSGSSRSDSFSRSHSPLSGSGTGSAISDTDMTGSADDTFNDKYDAEELTRFMT